MNPYQAAAVMAESAGRAYALTHPDVDSPAIALIAVHAYRNVLERNAFLAGWRAVKWAEVVP